MSFKMNGNSFAMDEGNGRLRRLDMKNRIIAVALTWLQTKFGRLLPAKVAKRGRVVRRERRRSGAKQGAEKSWKQEYRQRHWGATPSSVEL